MSGTLGHIAVIDDDPEMVALLRDYFSTEGYRVTTYPLASQALTQLGDDVDLVISDIKMPQMDGLTFVEALKKSKPEIPVVLITAFGSIETAIEAIKRGAYDYVVKPFKLAEVATTVQRTLEYRNLQRQNIALRQEVQKSWTLGDLIGKSPGMRSVFDMIQRVSQATANVLITGESGTGKEMVARAIHQSGQRRGRPFIAINCTAIPETLLESELFGHAKGSFTGAIQRKPGLFEEANGGTLFLDEIGDMNVSLQAKLLRVIQERKIRAVGDNTFRDVDVRIVTATHKDLKAAIREGLFREDLFYRLSVIPIMIPPLRHRQEDIPILAEHFLRKYAAANQSPVRSISKAAMQKLISLRWEGNVRELENVIERTVVLARNPVIEIEDLPDLETADPEQFFGQATGDFPTLETLERRYIQLVLEKCAGRKDKASQILGINRRTLYRKEREYGFVSSDSCDGDESVGLSDAELDAQD